MAQQPKQQQPQSGNTAPKAPGKAVDKPQRGFSLLEHFGKIQGIAADRVLNILRATAFRVKKGDPPASEEELIQLLAVSRVYNLNPFTKEIYAYRGRDGVIVPIIGFDGWVRIVEAQPTYRGHNMVNGWSDDKGPKGAELGFYYECTMHRSDRDHPVVRRVYFNENVRDTDPWNNMPTRMLMIRAYIQTARAAFGLGGIYDPDEGEVIAMAPGVDVITKPQPPAPQATEAARAAAEEPFANDDQLEHITELLSKTGLPDNLVLGRFELGDFKELRSHQVPDVLKFIQDNAP